MKKMMATTRTASTTPSMMPLPVCGLVKGWTSAAVEKLDLLFQRRRVSEQPDKNYRDVQNQ